MEVSITCRSVLDWMIGFIYHLQVVTTNNYKILLISTQQITRTR
jgi:hypothetical protein